MPDSTYVVSLIRALDKRRIEIPDQLDRTTLENILLNRVFGSTYADRSADYRQARLDHILESTARSA